MLSVHIILTDDGHVDVDCDIGEINNDSLRDLAHLIMSMAKGDVSLLLFAKVKDNLDDDQMEVLTNYVQSFTRMMGSSGPVIRPTEVLLRHGGK